MSIAAFTFGLSTFEMSRSLSLQASLVEVMAARISRRVAAAATAAATALPGSSISSTCCRRSSRPRPRACRGTRTRPRTPCPVAAGQQRLVGQQFGGQYGGQYGGGSIRRRARRQRTRAGLQDAVTAVGAALRCWRMAVREGRDCLPCGGTAAACGPSVLVSRITG